LDYPGFDFKNPDYTLVFAKRAEVLTKLRKDPKLLAATKIHYRYHPEDFINDWGMTYDPRALESGRLANIPFVLWPKQRDYLIWLTERWETPERGLVEKSRDCGVTWLSVGWAVSQWCFRDGFAAGFGSRKENLVDKLGDPDSIFEKIRHFVSHIPAEFLPDGFIFKDHATYMRLLAPNTGSSITGEGGDNIGRGGRKSIQFVDEAAFVEHQNLVDKALSQATNCQIDISTPNGNGNPFYKKRQRFNGTSKIFVFDWRDDPRKDDEWYQKQKDEQDETTVAQEIDRDYNASSEDAFIPAKWVAAAIDAHVKLGFAAEGIRATGFDPADTGDAKGVVSRHGSVVKQAKNITDGDITDAIPRAYEIADEQRSDIFTYDADGMGAPTMKLSLKASNAGRMEMLPYHGSSGVDDPDGVYSGDKSDPSSRVKTNHETFANYRSQTWTMARDRFHKTYIAVTRANNGQIVNADPEQLISISTQCEDWQTLQAELSRPKRIFTNNGKILVESKKDMRKRGVDSPNLADSLVMANAAKKRDVKKTKKINTPKRVILDNSVGW
jgi:phage terminase large subunit